MWCGTGTPSLNLRLVLQQSADAAISERLIVNIHGAGNLEAHFIMGMRVVFRQHGGALDASLDDLDRAARRGHKSAAFLLAMLLWRANRPTEHDLLAKELLAEAADDDPALAILNDRGVGLYTSTSWTRCGGTCGLIGTRPSPCLGQCLTRFTIARNQRKITPNHTGNPRNQRKITQLIKRRIWAAHNREHG